MVPWLVSASIIKINIVSLGLFNISENKGALTNPGISKAAKTPGWGLSSEISLCLKNSDYDSFNLLGHPMR